jgi:hypothetical protein
MLPKERLKLAASLRDTLCELHGVDLDLKDHEQRPRKHQAVPVQGQRVSEMTL